MSKSIGIIPARYASTRFPGKPLIDIAGKTMIQRVYEQASKANLDKVIVATDNQRIYEVVKNFGGKVTMTQAHKNGTSRCVEAFLAETVDYDILVNIQGDEPFVQPSQINALLQAFKLPHTQIATLAKRILQSKELFNPNIVKVVFSQAIEEEIYNALYFSRQAIPFVRDIPTENWLAQQHFYKHIGLYAFSRSFLVNNYPNIQSGHLETAEKLEQLAWLEQQCSIRILKTAIETPSIDSPEDLATALQWYQQQKDL